MKYNFSEVIDRVGKNSKKWDVGEGFISMTVADMDFPVAPEITEEILRRVAHGIYGYDVLDDAYYDSVVNWYKKANKEQTRNKQKINKKCCFLFGCLVLYKQRNDENVISNILQNIFYFYVAFLSKI